MVVWVALGTFTDHLLRKAGSVVLLFGLTPVSLFSHRWWRLRQAQASLLLTNHYRMQISRRKYNRARRGSVRLQAQFRGRTVRKVNAATKIQSFRRMSVSNSAYRKLKSATIALQCCARRDAAKKVFDEIKRAQKDMGKLKEHNEKLKMEMASLKAMLQAQAASDAGKAESEKAIAEKQKEIDRLEARIAELEAALEQEKENVKKLENDINVQKTSNKRLAEDLEYQKGLVAKGSSSPAPPQRKHSRGSSLAQAAAAAPAEQVAEAVVVGHTITPEALAMHRAEVARLEEQLEEERRMSRAARIEVKNLRAAIADKGVVDVTASTDLISDNVSEISGSEMDRSDIPIISEVEPQTRYVCFHRGRELIPIECVRSFHFCSVPRLPDLLSASGSPPHQKWNGERLIVLTMNIFVWLVRMLLFRLVFLLAFAIIVLLCGVTTVILRWDQRVNNTKMVLLATLSGEGSTTFATVTSSFDGLLSA